MQPQAAIKDLQEALGQKPGGLLLGRRDLIAAAKLNTNPHCGTLGRMMKVSKEDMVAVLAAVKRYVTLDHKAEWRAWERRLGVIERALQGIPSLRWERIVPPIANHVPHLLLSWDEKRVKVTRAQLTRKLATGDPPIQIGRVAGTGDRGVLISVFMLQEGEDQIVARQLRRILSKAST
jgi:seryl-tRNA(Sec) selenium transferase